MAAPETDKEKASKRKKVLLTVLSVVIVLGILVTAAYFSECQLIKVVHYSKDNRKHHRVSPQNWPFLFIFPSAVTASTLDKLVCQSLKIPHRIQCHLLYVKSSKQNA